MTNNEELKELEQVLEASKEEVSNALMEGSVLKVTATREVHDLLDDDTRKALESKQIKAMLGTDENGNLNSIAVFHSFIYKSVNSGAKEKAYQKLADAISEIHKTYGIVGFLAPPSEINLYCENMTLPRAVFCFPHIPFKSFEDYKERFLNTKTFGATSEGEVGEEVQ